MRRCRKCHVQFTPTDRQRRRYDWICAECERTRDRESKRRNYGERKYDLTIREIAAELGLKEGTVWKYLKNAMRKMRRAAETL